MSSPTDPPVNPQKPALSYKYRDIRVHSSDEWMADATKKYRRVYERYETTYIRAEFSFFNKLFDEQNWEATVGLKCYHLNGSQKNELCAWSEKRTINKEDNIVYVRYSWGNATPGAFWLRGDYVWEGYIDDVKVGESKFYVEDVGKIRDGDNPFFDIDSIQLFEGDGKASEAPTKTYLVQFSQKETRFVWCEFRFRNKLTTDYYAEVFFNFYNDAGQLKGSHPYLVYCKANTRDQVYTIYPGWGGDTPGRWDHDAYTMEIVFVDRLLATVPFKVAETAQEGSAPILTDTDLLLKAAKPNSAPGKDQSLDDLLYESLGELNALTGLQSIKTEVNEMVQLVKFYQETGKDVLSRFSLHTVFTGNPGTGKTTVARLLAKIYKGLGILEKGHLVEVDRAGLVAGYVGQTAIKTEEKITEAMGGILFIDEAYSLANAAGSAHDFGGEAIQVILKRMEDMRGKFGVIVAGYTGNMREFINSNPGLRSRFDKYFEFSDYSPEEMDAIATSIFRKKDAQPNAEASEHLRKYFHFLHSARDEHFGNARTVRQVVDEVIKNQHLRLAAMKKEERTPERMATVLLEDVLEFAIGETKGRPEKGLGFRVGGGQSK